MKSIRLAYTIETEAWKKSNKDSLLGGHQFTLWSHIIFFLTTFVKIVNIEVEKRKATYSRLLR